MKRRRLIVAAILALAAIAVAVIVSSVAGGGSGSSAPAAHAQRTVTKAAPPAPPPAPVRPAEFGVGLRIVRMVDTSRSATYRDGEAGPRRIIVEIRYPTLAPGVDINGAPPAKIFGPYPLVIFGHGYAVTPALYTRLQQSWARAGFVVAAPVFPLENADAPGGPNESDLVNQPADMSFVISRMLAASASPASLFAGLIAPTQVAVSGQSDGGDTALAVAYNPTFRDPRVRAAVILSGEEIPGVAGFTFPAGSPPLLAMQGTADNINLPARTEEYFAAAQSPKYLLMLLGAEHLPPYTYQEPQLSIVSRVSIAFLRGYLQNKAADVHRLPALGNVPGISTLTAFP